MTRQQIMFSPVTRLSGLLSTQVVVEQGRVVEADMSSTMFRGFEWIMLNRHITDAVYMTQRICGICSLAHGAVSSYLLDDLYDNDLSENAQYLRNIMFAADFLQNHIRHFYLFSLPDFVEMPEEPPFQRQNLADARLNIQDNQRLVGNYFGAIKASQESHQILALFGGKAPHQHSFVHGGVSVAPTADKVNQALSLLRNIKEFVEKCMLPDTELIARVYSDYFQIGITPGRLLSFGLFKFGSKNEQLLWKGGVLENNQLSVPQLGLIKEDISRSWFERDQGKIEPDPYKTEGYTWVKAVRYGGKAFEVGPLARMIFNGKYSGGTSTMDRICARSLETFLITELMEKWLKKLEPSPPPIKQKEVLVKKQAISTTDAMRGVLIHQAKLEGEEVKSYNVITPTGWNFSPKDRYGQPGPVESSLLGTAIPRPEMLFTVLGRIIRSFDPCMACATHVLDATGNLESKTIF